MVEVYKLNNLLLNKTLNKPTGLSTNNLKKCLVCELQPQKVSLFINLN
jgi:hypothetical protein